LSVLIIKTSYITALKEGWVTYSKGGSRQRKGYIVKVEN